MLDDAWTELRSLGQPSPVIIERGEFEGSLISEILKLYDITTPTLSIIKDKILDLFDEPVRFRELHYHTLHRPWTVHNDWTPPRDGGESYYNFLIPLHDVDSRTIIFDQRSDTTDRFNQYKKDHIKVKNPVPLDVWERHLSMCWPHDREYLSLKHIYPPQKKGQLIGFKRDYFHSSDGFHLKGLGPKTYAQIYIDRIIG